MVKDKLSRRYKQIAKGKKRLSKLGFSESDIAAAKTLRADIRRWQAEIDERVIDFSKFYAVPAPRAKRGPKYWRDMWEKFIDMEFYKHATKEQQNAWFYDSNTWQALRRLVIANYGNRCLCCGGGGQLHIDHIKPRSLYPELEAEFLNLQPLCADCNERKSNKHDTDYRVVCYFLPN